MAGKFNLSEYVEVQDRINKFWEENPDGNIVTSIVVGVADYDHAVVKAEVFKHKDNQRADSTGIAAEHRDLELTKGQRGEYASVNYTSWWENCETSAIGRALANMAYAKSNKSRPSREEMQKVERNQPTPINKPEPLYKLTDDQRQSMIDTMEGAGPDDWGNIAKYVCDNSHSGQREAGIVLMLEHIPDLAILDRANKYITALKLNTHHTEAAFAKRQAELQPAQAV